MAVRPPLLSHFPTHCFHLWWCLGTCLGPAVLEMAVSSLACVQGLLRMSSSCHVHQFGICLLGKPIQDFGPLCPWASDLRWLLYGVRSLGSEWAAGWLLQVVPSIGSYEKVGLGETCSSGPMLHPPFSMLDDSFLCPLPWTCVNNHVKLIPLTWQSLRDANAVKPHPFHLLYKWEIRLPWRDSSL